jgi:hypothetical protein
MGVVSLWDSEVKRKPDKIEDVETVSRIESILIREEQEAEDALLRLYGILPSWFPETERAKVISTLTEMLAEGISVDFLVSETHRDPPLKTQVPGVVREPASFLRAMHRLKAMALALKLDREEALKEILGPLAATGIKFKQGRKSNSFGPIRKTVRKLLTKNPKLTNDEIWETLKKHPPKDWEVMENRLGRYLSGPEGKGLQYRGFQNVCSGERKKLKEG